MVIPLRGMGWKDGEEIGRSKNSTSKVKDVKRRPALLGIGAKEEAAVGVEPMPLADVSRVTEGERAADDDGGGSVLPFCGRGVK